MKTLLYSSPDLKCGTTLNTHSYNLNVLLNSIDFDAIEPEHIIKLKPILDQECDINLYGKYITSILNKNDEKLKLVLTDTWNRLGSSVLKFPIFILEKSIKVCPVIFEKTVLSALLTWKMEDLIDVCSKSPLVFQTCSSIFNELLMKLEFTDFFMVFLMNFLNCVSTQCENVNVDFVNMYPIKCRSLLTIRSIKNKDSRLVSNEFLSEEVKKFALNHPKESMCLLYHFPDLNVPS